MKNLKKKNILFTVVALVLLGIMNGCGAKSKLVGSWMFMDVDEIEYMTFNEDGTCVIVVDDGDDSYGFHAEYTADNDIITFNYNNGLEEMYYSFDGDKLLLVYVDDDTDVFEFIKTDPSEIPEAYFVDELELYE